MNIDQMARTITVSKLQMRNLTTGKLHTDIGEVYQLLEKLTEASGIMTHQIPNALRALEPWLRQRVTGENYWNDEYEPDHEGDITIALMTEQEKKEYWERYSALPHPFSQLGATRKDVADVEAPNVG